MHLNAHECREEHMETMMWILEGRGWHAHADLVTRSGKNRRNKKSRIW